MHTITRRRERREGSSPGLLLLGVLAIGCAHAASAPAPAPAADPPPTSQPSMRDYLVRRTSFTMCELEGFIALSAARNAFALGVSKEAMLAGTKPPERRAMLEELYARKESGALKNHASFAEERFYQCTDTRGLTLEKKRGAATCLARLDIIFYMDSYRAKGATQAQMLARFKRAFAKSPKDVYPDALVEKLAPMVYRATTDDDNYELRRFVFETCLFPDEWKAWWDGTHAEAR